MYSRIAYSVSGVNPPEVYAAATRLMERLQKYPDLATVSSDFFNSTPSIDIDIKREQAKTYGQRRPA